MLPIGRDDFVRLTGYMQSHYGINLIKKKTLIEGRLSNIILEKGFQTFHDYLDSVFNDKTGKEMGILINRLTTNHTFFMRESRHFSYFHDTVLPYLASGVKDRDLHIWSAGCSSGEEPYTLEMILFDFFGKEKLYWDTQILATDISSRVLKIAQEGIYSVDAIAEIPPSWKLSYFEKLDAQTVQIKQEIRKNVLFRAFNLMEPSFPFRRKFHVIFCRNVMIYFDQPTKNRLVQKFYDNLEDGGYLFIGHSESIDRESSKFHYIMPAVYRKGLCAND